MKILISIFLFILCFSINGFSQKNNTYILQIVLSKPGNLDSYRFKKSIFSVKDSAELFLKLEKIKGDLIKSAYLSASIDSLVKRKGGYFAYLYVGNKYHWGKLNTENIAADALRISRINKLDGAMVDFEDFKSRQRKLLDYYTRSAYPFARIGIDSLSIVDGLFNANLVLDKNQKIYFDTIYVKGKVDLSRKLIYKYIGIKPGDFYNQEKLDNLDAKLNKLSYLTVAKPAELEFFEQKVDVFVYLKKKKSNFFSGIIGFSSDEKDRAKLKLTGNLDLNLNNSFSIGENIRLRWENYKDSSQLLTTSIRFPYLFFLPIGFIAKLALDKNTLDYLNLDYSFALSYDINTENSFEFYFRKKQSFLINADFETNISVRSTNSYTIGLSARVNKTDRLLAPHSGFWLSLFSGYGERYVEQSGNTSLIEAGFSGAYYWQLTDNLIFSFKNASNAVLQDAGFYENEMFKLGGIKSIRGFDEKSILATTYSIFTLEPRLFIGKYSFLSVFADYIYLDQYAIIQRETSYGLGLGTGISIDTKGGLFSLNFAVGSMNNQAFRLSNTKVHIAYVVRF